ncbi:MAG: hypothetical protein WAO35_20075 [Terriglobia bacterium]
MPDSINLTIAAKTMEDLGAVDPEVAVDIIEVTPLSRPVSRTPVPNFNTTATLQIPYPEGFPTWQVNVTFSRFDVVSGFFFQPRPNASQHYDMKVVRLPDKWTPQFTSLGELLSPRFDRFKEVLAVSTDVDLKHGPAVGNLCQTYDALADPAQILGKTALLNLYAVLTDEQDPVDSCPWFNHVRKIVRIDQERFVAEADAGLFENIQIILRDLDSTYKAQGYFTESAALHTDNIPPQYDAEHNLLMPMITIKKKYEQGNVQLTMSALSTANGVVHLLDCDMDEHANIEAHALDLIKHLFNGGTSPIAMHEYIVEDSAQQSHGVATVDLGYRLV